MWDRHLPVKTFRKTGWEAYPTWIYRLKQILDFNRRRAMPVVQLPIPINKAIESDTHASNSHGSESPVF